MWLPHLSEVMIISPPLLAHCAPLGKNSYLSHIFKEESFPLIVPLIVTLSWLGHRGAFASPPSWIGLFTFRQPSESAPMHCVAPVTPCQKRREIGGAGSTDRRGMASTGIFHRSAELPAPRDLELTWMDGKVENTPLDQRL